MALSTSRTTANTRDEHVSDHNTLHGMYNSLEGFPASLTAQTGANSSNALNAPYKFSSTQSSGGGSSAVPCTVLVEGSVTGGTFNHQIGLLSYLQPGGSDPVGAASPDRYAIEGRVDAVSTSTSSVGVLGLVALDASGALGVGVRARCDIGAGGTLGTGLAVGLWAWGKHSAANFDAIFGEGAASGENGKVSFRGYITDGAGTGEVTFQVDDVTDLFVVDITDAKVDGVRFKLANAGLAALQVTDQSNNLKFEAFGAGFIRLQGATIIHTGTGSPESVVSANPGSLFLRTDGGASSTLYVKTSGTGTTGWTAK